jgi:hypothetical protein
MERTMNTYQNQLRADEARIEGETMQDECVNYAERSGRFAALAHHYAGCADFEAAKYQAVANDPLRAVALMTAKGITPAILADCLYQLANSLPPSDACDWQDTISKIEAAADAAFEEAGAIQRRAEDLDASASTRSDEACDRRIDAGLIGRSKFLPVAQS